MKQSAGGPQKVRAPATWDCHLLPGRPWVRPRRCDGDPWECPKEWTEWSGVDGRHQNTGDGRTGALSLRSVNSHRVSPLCSSSPASVVARGCGAGIAGSPNPTPPPELVRLPGWHSLLLPPCPSRRVSCGHHRRPSGYQGSLTLCGVPGWGEGGLSMWGGVGAHLRVQGADVILWVRVREEEVN